MSKKTHDFSRPDDTTETHEKETGRFSVLRDGALIGVSMTKEDAKTFVKESRIAYPTNIFKIVPGGEPIPGDMEE